MDEFNRKVKLRLFRADYRKKSRHIWYLFNLSLIISIVSVFGVAYMDENPWDYSIFWFVICTVGYTFGLGYISGFIFYYLNEYLPKTRKLFENIQISLLLIDKIYYCARKFEEAVLDNKEIESSGYAEYIANEISTINNGKCLIIEGAIKLFHILAIEIEFEEKRLYEIEGEVISIETLKAISLLNIYKALMYYNSLHEINHIKEVDRDDLLKALNNFKGGLDSLEKYIKEKRKYSIYKIE